MLKFSKSEVVSMTEPYYEYAEDFTGVCVGVAFNDYEGNLTPAIKVRDFSLEKFGTWEVLDIVAREVVTSYQFSDRETITAVVRYVNGQRV